MFKRLKFCCTKNTCTGEMASKLLVLGARPLGMTPGGGCRALFMTLLQFATMVRIVSDSSWDTLLEIHIEKNVLKQQFSNKTYYLINYKILLITSNCERVEEWCIRLNNILPCTGLQTGQHGS